MEAWVHEKLATPETVDARFRAYLKRLPEATRKPFEGARLRPTGRSSTFDPSNYALGSEVDAERAWALAGTSHEYEVVADQTSFCEIPGHRVVGYAETEDQGAHWLVRSLWDSAVFNRAFIERELDPKRCDVCGKRINRKKLVVLVDENDKAVVTGGSCARKFRDVDLFALVDAWVGGAERVLSGFMTEDGLLGCGSATPELAKIIAVSEQVIDASGGYRSCAKAEEEGGVSTKTEVSEALRSNEGFDLGVAVKRANDLLESGYAEHRAYFRGKIEAAEKNGRFDEFSSNCLAVLETGFTEKFGIAVFLGSIRDRIKAEAARKARPTVTGFSGAPVGKCSDLGEFEVVRTTVRDGHYGSSLCFTCLNEKGEKLWWKTSLGAAHLDDYDELVNDQRRRCVRDKARIFVTLRGTLTEVKDDISFAKRVKIKAVREEVAA